LIWIQLRQCWVKQKKVHSLNNCLLEFLSLGVLGANGYWAGNRTIIQVKDCIDCLAIIFQDKYDNYFLFHHSSGHAKKRANGLDVKCMTKGWGGKMMRPTLIKTLEDYVGPYYDANNPGMVKVGKEQAMVYGSDDVGPFNLAANERERIESMTHMI